MGELTVAAYLSDGHLAPDSSYVHELRDVPSRAGGATLLVAVAVAVAVPTATAVAVADGPQVAGDGGSSVLGTVTFCLADTRYAEVSVTGEAEFRMLAVSPPARGRGVGRALAGRCVDLAREAGASAVALCSMATMTHAHDIYRGMGFERTPERDWEPVPGLTLLTFRLAL